MNVRKFLCCFICNHCPETRDTSSTVSNDTRINRSLKSANGLIDWIRLGNSGVDLTGVGGRQRSIYPAELKKHNTQDDAWLAIRGRVYNITHYLSYHPGGVDELMRGVGRDATELFDKIHPWINYESLLVKCLIGTLRIDNPDSDVFFDANDSFPESDLLIPSSVSHERTIIRNNLTNYTTPPRKKRPIISDDYIDTLNTASLELEELSLPGYLGTLKVLRREKFEEEVPPALFYDWEQSPTHLTITVYTGPLSNPGVYSRVTDRNLTIEVTINDWVRTIRIMPEESLQEHLLTNLCYYTGKIEVTARKAERKSWKSCGEVIIGTATKINSYQVLDYTVVSNKMITHDTRLLSMVPSNGSVVIPLGNHIRIHQTIAGSEYIRSYTPVSDFWDAKCDAPGRLHLAVKRYDNGVLSPLLTSLNSGDMLKASGAYGTFKLHRLKSTTTIYLLAAGTGVTPMLELIKFMLSRLNPKCEHIHLLYFNKTEKDIMFQEKLDVLANEDKRFNVVHILSNASSAWTGRKGRISAKLLAETLDENDFTYDEGSSFTCLCGPKEFTYAGLSILKSLGVEESFIHVFVG